MHFGLCMLRLAPRDFWAMTPRELTALAGAARPVSAPDRARMIEMMNKWPDKEA